MLGKIVDILLFLYIALNVLAFEFPIVGIPARYVIFAALIIISLIAYPNAFFRKDFSSFILTVFVMYTFLFLYSVIVGNKIENIMIFIRPLLVLFTIPAFSSSMIRYGEEHYLKYFSYACVAMIIVFLYVFFRSLIDFGYAMSINEAEGLIFVNVHQILPRVVIKTFVFMIPFSAYVMNKLKGFWLHLFFLFILLTTLLSQTMGIVFTIVLLYLFILRERGFSKSIFVTIIIISAVYVLFDTLYFNEVFASKAGSSDLKGEQLSNIFKDLDCFTFFFGRGVGCEFVSFDSRQVTEQIIEIAAVQIFQMGGLIFSFFILYVYLIPALRGLKKDNSNLRSLSLYQIGIFVASMFNPYLWGGGTGLLFVSLILAASVKNNQNLKYISR